MSRNQAVWVAQENNYDVLVMCDSDQHPNLHKDEPFFEPFFQSSFDFLYDHWESGPVCIGVPYCGPPNGTENMYVFRWDETGDHGPESPFSLEQYTRFEATLFKGIQPVAALPTGLIMYDMRCFDLIKPPYFEYEWTDQYQREKASTEDVQNTRDIALCGQARLGYNPVHCNWDSPIGHWKPWCVSGRPTPLTTEMINERMQTAIREGKSGLQWAVDPEHMGMTMRELVDSGQMRLKSVGLPQRDGGNGELDLGGSSTIAGGRVVQKQETSADRPEMAPE